MKVAFHFDADDPAGRAEGRYDLTFLKRFFSTLREADANANAHVKIWHGDYSAWEYGQTPQGQAVVAAVLFQNRHKLWNEVDAPRFLSRIFATNVYVIVAEGLSAELSEQIHEALKAERAYYGALQVYEAIKAHWELYHKGLAPRYRYFRGQLRIFYSGDEEESRDTGLEPYWIKSQLFQSVIWENVGLRYSFLESRDNFDDAKRLAELDRMLPAELSVMADDFLMRLRDERPQLCDELYAACEKLRTVKTSADAAQAAVSCRRFLIFLADVVSPVPADSVNGRTVRDSEKRKRLFTYIEKKLKGDDARSKAERDDLKGTIKILYGDASDGVHNHIGKAELDSIIWRLVTFTYRVLQLAAPPLTLPDEPYEEDLWKFLQLKQDD